MGKVGVLCEVIKDRFDEKSLDESRTFRVVNIDESNVECTGDKDFFKTEWLIKLFFLTF